VNIKDEEQRLIGMWTGMARSHLMGKVITDVSYITDEEQEDRGWYSKTVVIKLNNGVELCPICDEEGNDAGVLETNIKDLEIIPTI
tara:strand:+ start:92 stop:349 length:258 start_codon:yes stop_codon:yes gene_type:complete